MTKKHRKKESGVLAVAKKHNVTELTSPKDRKINRENFWHCVGKGNVGKTPPTRGRPTFIPGDLPRALSTHAILMQVCGRGEAT